MCHAATIQRGTSSHLGPMFFLVSLHCVSCVFVFLCHSLPLHVTLVFATTSGYNCYFHSGCYYFLSLLLLFPFGLLLLLLLPFAFTSLLLFFLFKLLFLPFTLLIVLYLCITIASFHATSVNSFCVVVRCWCASLCTLVTIIDVPSHHVIKACTTLPFAFCKLRFGDWSFS